MAKQPLKKKNLGSGLQAFKEKNGFSATNGNMTLSNADKPIEWLVMPKAFQEATRLVGFPKAYVSMISGFSDTGKTTILNHILVSAQQTGDIPVIFDTENNFDFKYAQDMGFEAEPVYGEVEIEDFDQDTGEFLGTHKETRIVGYDGSFIYFNNAILADRYGNNDYGSGKQTKNKRKEACIEDIAAAIKELLDAQDNGEIEQGFVFVWDSIGSINSYRSITSASNNNMFDAGAVSTAFSNILNNRIPSSRKVTSKYSNTLIAVTKIWLDSMTAPMAQPSVKYKNGNTFFYACHGLIIHVGGALTRGVKELKAVSKGATYKYGIESKIKVTKNHLPSPYNITYEGPIICTAYGLISKDELPEFQKQHVSEMLNELNKQLSEGQTKSEATDVSFIEEETERED